MKIDSMVVWCIIAFIMCAVGMCFLLFRPYDKDLGNVQVSVIIGAVSENTITEGEVVIRPVSPVLYGMRSIDRIYATSAKGLITGRSYELTLNIRSNGFAPIAHLLDFKEIKE